MIILRKARSRYVLRCVCVCVEGCVWGGGGVGWVWVCGCGWVGWVVVGVGGVGVWGWWCVFVCVSNTFYGYAMFPQKIKNKLTLPKSQI